MVEDALGLKVYQYKKQESERKLEHTEQHKKEVESLRREIAPHLTFLKTQVEKVEKTRATREELAELYRAYLSAERARLDELEHLHATALAPLRRERDEVVRKLSASRETLRRLEGGDEKTRELLELEAELSRVRSSKERSTRALGQLEGELRARRTAATAERDAVPRERVIELHGVLEPKLLAAEGSSDVSFVKRTIAEVRELLGSFVSSLNRSSAAEDKLRERVEREKAVMEKELKRASVSVLHLEERYRELKEAIEADQHSGREAERSMFELSAREQELAAKIAGIERDEESRRRDRQELADEGREAAALVSLGGGTVSAAVPFASEEERGALRKRIERLKIRLEDAGGGSGEDVLREYEEVSARDAFLERELTDLSASAEKLHGLIHELDERLSVLFAEGVALINEQFQELFALMFGGGTASLELVRALEETVLDADADLSGDRQDREGIEIRVALPRKKIRGLHMLSGGERALTSIALLFAMSQVNPPPFLLLDETDAALDEANSRRYGDMIEKLSESSQLILITHNRETMSRAGVLYGVTMGRDGVSQLLSVSFDEAARVAK